jgi:hypothetical protein
MTRISTLARAASELTTVLALTALIAVTAGCTGGSGSTAAAPPAPGGNSQPPAPIEGVATPSSVAVVTATNAQ